jgi:hypothetical protein
MTRVSVSSGHPITVIAADPVGYHFCQLIDVTKNVVRLRLRRAVPDARAINIRSIIIEALGNVTVEIDCRNISAPGGSFLSLEIVEPVSLDIRVADSRTQDLK